MRSACLLPLLCLLSLTLVSLGQDQQETLSVPETCSVTKLGTQPFVPPPPYAAKPSLGQFWFGTDRLWTALPEAGAWIGLPHYTHGDPTFRQKLAFWRQGYDAYAKTQARLTVSGRRIDATALPLQTDGPGSPSGHGGRSFLMTGINLPTAGCWEITGRYESDEVTFVVWVGTTEDVARWKQGAEGGDATAQFWLVVVYEGGKGAEQDFALALRWFRESAKQGNQDAQNMLGQMYEDAEGVSQDYSQAAKWYRAACKHKFNGGGAGQGCNNLGLLYLDGHGVKRNRVEAYKYFRLAGTEDNLETAKSGMSASEVAEAESQTQQWLRVHRDE
jgi:hypothetical protein